MSYFDFEIKDMSEVEKKAPKRRGIVEKYPFSKLDIGQGFKMPSDVNIQSFRCLAYQRGKSLGRKFSVSVSGYVERVA